MRTKNTVTITSDNEIDAGIAHVMAAVPLASRHAVARAALRVGMPLLVKDPASIVGVLGRSSGKPSPSNA